MLPPNVCPLFFTFLFDHWRLSHCWDLPSMLAVASRMQARPPVFFGTGGVFNFRPRILRIYPSLCALCSSKGRHVTRRDRSLVMKLAHII
jgi:hypothetical protein